MTREKAIDMVKYILETMPKEPPTECDYIEEWFYEDNKIKKALDMAIKALEQEPCEDAVSRAEVKKIAKEMYLEVANMELDAKTISDCISCTSSKCREVLERKLQALSSVTPQEPFINKPCVSSEVCKHDKKTVLDKIRAEITELDNEVCQRFLIEDIDKEVHHTYQECLDIIDKYKAESEK